MSDVVPQPWIVSTDEASFEADVLQRSHAVPVVVDFWAEWCGPCRTLGPVLESLAEQYAGRFILVKAETEKVPEAAARFNVSSIPAVFAVVGGEPVDYFVGALPKEQIAAWLDRVLLAGRVRTARDLEATDPAAAERLYRELSPQLPNDPDVSIGLARSLVALQRFTDARSILERLERRGFLEPEAERVRADLELRAAGVPDVDACRSALAADPADLDRRLALGQALAAAGEYPEALEVLLAVVPLDRQDKGDRARRLMVDIFRLLPADSQLVRDYRRKLSSALY